jgi:DNA repair exonuclease SbcCD nuclease subunit
MWRKVDFILALAVQYRCPVLIAGDVGLKSQWPNWLEEELIRRIKETSEPVVVYAIPGQHDLPNHQLSQWRQSAIGVLHQAEAVTILGVDGEKYRSLQEPGLWSVFTFAYGEEIRNPSDMNEEGRDWQTPLIAIVHILVTEGKREDKDQFLMGAEPALSLLKKYDEYSLILTGDNHKPFVVEHEGRLLVNPGSLLRTTADQADHKPRIYLWYHGENRVEPVYLPIEEGVIDRSHIDSQEAKDERIEAYVVRLSEEVEVGLSFEGNLEAYFKSNRIKKAVQDKVWAAMPK